jgi:prepilin-type N-terminal cleavage/methylation domain-containing protein
LPDFKKTDILKLMPLKKLLVSWLLVISKNRIPTNHEPLTNHHRGFTLIELLVAIAIIAIISTIGLVSYSKAQELARDGKRKTDLKAVQTALALYHQANGVYPSTTGCPQVSSHCVSVSTQWIPGINNNHINKLPQDPTNSGSGCGPWTTNCYLLSYWSNSSGPCGNFGTSQYYMLVAQMENKTDPDRIGAPNKDVRFCDGNYLSGFHTWSPYAFVINNY